MDQSHGGASATTKAESTHFWSGCGCLVLIVLPFVLAVFPDSYDPAVAFVKDAFLVVSLVFTAGSLSSAVVRSRRTVRPVGYLIGLAPSGPRRPCRLEFRGPLHESRDIGGDPVRVGVFEAAGFLLTGVFGLYARGLYPRGSDFQGRQGKAARKWNVSRAEPAVAPDRGRITAVQGSTSVLVL